MSSRWTHSLCRECYQVEEPGRDPVRTEPAAPETCCRCQACTMDGIYYRKDPEAYGCKGAHS